MRDIEYHKKVIIKKIKFLNKFVVFLLFKILSTVYTELHQSQHFLHNEKNHKKKQISLHRCVKKHRKEDELCSSIHEYYQKRDPAS